MIESSTRVQLRSVRAILAPDIEAVAELADSRVVALCLIKAASELLAKDGYTNGQLADLVGIVAAVDHHTVPDEPADASPVHTVVDENGEQLATGEPERLTPKDS